MASLGLLLVTLLSVVLLTKSLAPALEAGVVAVGAPLAIAGVIVAAIVLLPEAPAHNRLQASIDLALGSAVASIGLAVPGVILVPPWASLPLDLGFSSGASVLMALGFVVHVMTYGTERMNLLSRIVRLVVLATYVFTVFAP